MVTPDRSARRDVRDPGRETARRGRLSGSPPERRRQTRSLDRGPARRDKRDAPVPPGGRKGDHLFRKSLLLLSGNAAAAGFTLIRNLLVARLIPVEDYGVAATFALTMAVVEMASAFGLTQQIIQARDGEDPRFQAALQGFQLVRGVVSALILLVLADPLARFLRVPDVAWAYQALALMPILTALVHFDVYRMQRRMSYGAGILTLAVPAALSAMLVWPLAQVVADWQVMLWAILLQGLATAGMSHLVAERRYALALDRSIMIRSLRFGWPMLVNAVFLFFIFHGEKLIVGRELGMAALGIFAMGVTLTLTPTLVVERSIQSIFLPQLSATDWKSADGGARFRQLSATAVEAHLLFGNALVLATMVFGPPFVLLVLGAKYAELVPLLTLMAVMQALRVFKGGASTVALAMAQTENPMMANILRILLLPVAWAVAADTGRLDLVLALGIAGEMAGFAVALVLMRYRARVPLRPLALPVATSLGLLAAAAGQNLLAASAGVWVGPAVTAVLFVAALAAMRGLRGHSDRHTRR